MKVTLELNEEEVQTLRPLADAAGVDLETVLHHLIAQLLPPPMPSAAPVLKEDAEEDAERRREQEEMQANIKRWHAENAAN